MKKLLLLSSLILITLKSFAVDFRNSMVGDAVGDTVVVNVDMKANANPTELIFNSFEDVWAELKGRIEICEVISAADGDLTGDKIKLLKPVVIKVAEYEEGYSGNEVAGATGGGVNDVKAIFFRNININGGKELIIRSKTKNGLKATLKHVVIRRSKNITLDDLNIVGASNELRKSDNAIDIDNGCGKNNLENLEPNDWNLAEIGSDTEESNILIKNCNISSSGNVCIHMSAYDGVTFENNEIKSDFDFENETDVDNAVHWGASVKFINSKNISFVRNTVVNNHATSVLLQGTKNVLIHNNVLWQNNTVNTNANTVSAIRLISYEHKEDCKAFASDINPVINGPAGVRAGVEGIVYNTTAIDGATYEWILPEGWNITSGNNTNNIIVSTPDGEGSGTIYVNITINECTVSTSIDVKWKNGITVYFRRSHATREKIEHDRWYEKSIDISPSYMKFGVVNERPSDTELYSYNGGVGYGNTDVDENEIAILGVEAFTDAEGHVWDMYNVAEDFTDVYFRAPNDNPDAPGSRFYGWACYSLSCHVETPIKEDLYFTVAPWEYYHGTTEVRKGRVLYQVTSPRLANQIPSRFPLENIGIYYNTIFIKDSNANNGVYNNFDFFRLGGNHQTTIGLEANFNPNTIKFAYNNCFSFDTDITGFNNYYEITKLNNEDTYKKEYYLGSLLETNWYSSFIGNNFWSVYDKELAGVENPTYSVLDVSWGLGVDNKFINVEDLLCNKLLTCPDMLVIKGTDLDVGGEIELPDVSGLLNNEFQNLDRREKVRPESGKTLGAYQQGGILLDKIIWHGSESSEWDNRNNWYKEDGSLVNCMDQLSENLEVIIPAPVSTKYKTPAGGVATFPIVPDIATDTEFNARATKWNNEQLNAGASGKIADKIVVEYGGAILGVENLNSNNSDAKERYREAQVEFIARRNDWLLVGAVVKPWDEDEEGNTLTVTRNVVSGDYYLGHFPHVYMREAVVNDDGGVIEATWNESFANLDVEVPHDRAFAIRIPNQYGPSKFPAEKYNERNGTNYDPKEAIRYTFTGRFYNESALPSYSVKPCELNILSNTYPANISAKALQDGKGNGNGSVQYYDYDKKSFVALGSDDMPIMAQHSFVFTPKAELTTLTIDKTYFLNTETGHRSLANDIQDFRVKVTNNTSGTASEVYIRFDELKEDLADYGVDAPKLFNGMETTLPDLYVMRYDKKWAGLSIPDVTKPIPLGVRVSANDHTFTFSLLNSNLPFDIFLEDRQEEKTYNLSAGEVCEVSDLVKGRSEGRFYLLLSEKPEEDIPDDDDVTTEVEETETANAIDIFTQGSIVVVSASEDVELQKVIVSDISGRVKEYNVSGRYIKLDLPVSSGIYTLNVISNKFTKVKKIKLN